MVGAFLSNKVRCDSEWFKTVLFIYTLDDETGNDLKLYYLYTPSMMRLCTLYPHETKAVPNCTDYSHFCGHLWVMDSQDGYTVNSVLYVWHNFWYLLISWIRNFKCQQFIIFKLFTLVYKVLNASINVQVLQKMFSL